MVICFGSPRKPLHHPYLPFSPPTSCSSFFSSSKWGKNTYSAYLQGSFLFWKEKWTQWCRLKKFMDMSLIPSSWVSGPAARVGTSRRDRTLNQKTLLVKPLICPYSLLIYCSSHQNTEGYRIQKWTKHTQSPPCGNHIVSKGARL